MSEWVNESKTEIMFCAIKHKKPSIRQPNLALIWVWPMILLFQRGMRAIWNRTDSVRLTMRSATKKNAFSLFRFFDPLSSLVTCRHETKSSVKITCNTSFTSQQTKEPTFCPWHCQKVSENRINDIHKQTNNTTKLQNKIKWVMQYFVSTNEPHASAWSKNRKRSFHQASLQAQTAGARSIGQCLWYW